MPPRRADEALSHCPVCGRAGLVGKEHEIVGARSVTVYKCHGCDYSWRIRHGAPTAIERTPREPSIPLDPPLGRQAPEQGAVQTVRAPRIVILNAIRAAAYEPHGDEVCISIRDPKAEPLRLSPNFKDVLRLEFSDIAEPGFLPSHVRFSPDHARQVLDFIGKWRTVERIVIHCIGGVSRSPAIGMALCDLHDWPLERLETEHPMWNPWVRSELVRIGRESRAQPAARAKSRKRATRKRRAAAAAGKRRR